MRSLQLNPWCPGMPGYRGRVSIATGPQSPRPPACPSFCGLCPWVHCGYHDAPAHKPSTQESNRAIRGSEHSFIYTLSYEGKCTAQPAGGHRAETSTPGTHRPFPPLGSSEGEGLREAGGLHSTQSERYILFSSFFAKGSFLLSTQDSQIYSIHTFCSAAIHPTLLIITI